MMIFLNLRLSIQTMVCSFLNNIFRLLSSFTILLKVHGWINTNKHVENRDVDFGDFENFLEHMKDQDGENKKVLAFDSGDWTQVFYFLSPESCYIIYMLIFHIFFKNNRELD